VVIITWLYFIGNVIFGQIAYFRLKKVEESIQAGTEKGSAVPNVYITIGWILGAIGSILRLKGAQLRSVEEQPVTIL
jgi:hypothetical protein